MVIQGRICPESGNHGGGKTCETMLGCPSKPIYTLRVVEEGISGEGYNEGGLGTPDNELYYQGSCRQEDEDLAARMNAFGGGWKYQGGLDESGWEI